MALDANLFSYELRTVDGVTEMYAWAHRDAKRDPSPTFRYARQPPPGYVAELADGLVDVALASVIAESSAVESKSLRLHDPDHSVAFRRRAPSLYHDWRFVWDEQVYQWRKELRLASAAAYTCTAIRKSDPDIAIATYRPASRSQPALIRTSLLTEIYDYNVARMETRDRRGLEAVLILSLMTLLDLENDTKASPKRQKRPSLPPQPVNAELTSTTSPLSSPLSTRMPDNPILPPPSRVHSVAGATPPATPPRTRPSMPNLQSPRTPRTPRTPARAPAAPISPPPRSAHAEKVLIGTQNATTYVEHVISLLRNRSGPAHIVLLSESRDLAAKVVSVAAEAKDAYMKLPQESRQNDLFQYVLLGKSEVSGDGSRRRSNGYGADYVPPEELQVVLSTERMPDLEVPPASSA
ncbi:hypothetical protein MCUN1_001316 [Malassezia cuniculi]|uniref:Uncharacterized protein n=1 Tax=Malassezia cuniculi TaxID=948313 RepID=A0AAF0ESL0_9BASI|nr:hypothetical protein MCUN1_001316 [Malassezia cuniculi]